LEPKPHHAIHAERASALVVGIGALGCQAAAALVSAGIGDLTLVDDDRVERSNLQRQVLFDDTDIGRSKAIAAALALRAEAPASTISARTERVTPRNAADLVGHHDLTIDATDDPDSKYLLNRSGRENRSSTAESFARPTLAVQPGVSACLACAFPPQPARGDESCAALGIIAPVAGAIGALQAHLALRLLEDPASVGGLLYVYEMHGRRWRTLRFERDPQCSTCSDAAQRAA
jgi:molybdopterin/thiamine biosynthesis adenylyltransferase